MLTNTRQLPGKINKILPNGRCPWIEGYCSMNSVRAGEKLQVMVSTNPASAFKLEIFRTGYYNGDGGRLMQTFDTLEGKLSLILLLEKTTSANAIGSPPLNSRFQRTGSVASTSASSPQRGRNFRVMSSSSFGMTVPAIFCFSAAI